MKKFITTLLFILAISSTSLGAVSDDMSLYVRKDVYEAHQQSINSKLDMILEQQKAFREEVRGEMKDFREELKAQRKDINELAKSVSVLSERIDRNFETLSGRIDGLNSRMGDQQNYLYLVLVLLGIIVALPSVQKILQNRAERKPSFTLDDVRRLIEENNAKMSWKVQS